MRKAFVLLLVLLFFSCDPAVGTISEQDFTVAKYIVDGVESDLKLSYGIGYNRNFCSIKNDINEHTLIVSLSIESSKVCKDGHINLIISNKLEYDGLEIIKGTINSTDNEKVIESVSVGEYENIKIKLLWKGDFTSTSEICIDYVDNRNKRQYSPIAFELVDKEII